MKYNATQGIGEKDRLSPFQGEGKRLYRGPEKKFTDELLNFCRQSKKSSLPKLKINKSEKFTVGEMGTSSLQINFLKLLLLSGSFKKILEIGTFIGSTTLAMASQLPDKARITTIEIGQEFAGIARKNFKASKDGHKIKLIEGDALKILGAMNGQTSVQLRCHEFNALNRQGPGD